MPYRTDNLTGEELEAIKAKRRESQRKYYLANKQKCIDASMRSRNKDPERHKAVQAEYRRREAEKIRAYSDTYIKANAEKLKASTKQWREKNRDKYDSYQKEYRAKNAENITKRIAGWRKENRSKEKVRLAMWATNNKDRRCISEQNRRARKLSSGGRLSAGLADKLLMLQKGKCACCHAPLNNSYHLDHIMPLALGGSHEDDNIQILCPDCNLSKHAKHPVDFMQKKGFLL